MCEHCLICGAPISDSNPDGIGCECRQALKKAKFHMAVENGYYLKKYVLEVEAIRKRFLENYAEVKFRSAFRKSFYESMKTAERISKKQREIMEGLLTEKGLSYMSRDDAQKIDAYLLNFVESQQVDRKMIEIARHYIRKNQ